MFTFKLLPKKTFCMLKRSFLSSLFLVFTIFALAALTVFLEYLFRFNFGDEYNGYILPVKAFILFMIVSPLYYGVCLWFAEVSKGQTHKFWEAFGYFTSPRLIIRCVFHRLLHTLLFILYCLPGVIFALLSLFSFAVATDSADVHFFLLCICFAVVSISVFTLGMIAYCKFSLSTYIFVTSPQMGVVSCFALSKKLTKGQLSNLFTYKLKLNIMWLLLILFFPIAISLKSVALSLSYAQMYNSDAVFD